MPQGSPDGQRVLVVDIRARRFGYVVMEGPDELLDWGVRTHSIGSGSALSVRILNLCKRFSPTLIVTRQVRQADRRYRTHARVGIHTIKRAAGKLSIPVQLVSTSSLVKHFSGGNKISKYERARIVATRFPELAWRLPPKRKAWQSELKRTTIFDAASIGMFHFAQGSK
jgi:hypothetical protein